VPAIEDELFDSLDGLLDHGSDLERFAP
jgi:hypothetical protein